MKDDDAKSWLPVWGSTVQAYTRRNVTKAEDKLVALTGLAEQMSLPKSERVDNAAGLWEENIYINYYGPHRGRVCGLEFTAARSGRGHQSMAQSCPT